MGVFQAVGDQGLDPVEFAAHSGDQLVELLKRLPVQRVQAAVAEHLKVAHHVAFGKTVEHLGDAGNRQGLEHAL